MILLVVVGRLRASRRRHMSLTITLEREGHDRTSSDRRTDSLRRRGIAPGVDDHDDHHDDGADNHDDDSARERRGHDDDQLDHVVDHQLDHYNDDPDVYDLVQQLHDGTDDHVIERRPDDHQPDDDVPRLRPLDDDPPNRDAATPRDPLTGEPP